jgi:hypothetical protein
MRFARFIDSTLESNGETCALYGDLLEIHAKCVDGTEYVAKGPQTTIHFWVEEAQIKFCEPLDASNEKSVMSHGTDIKVVCSHCGLLREDGYCDKCW